MNIKKYNNYFDESVNMIKDIIKRENRIYYQNIETEFKIDIFLKLKWTILYYDMDIKHGFAEKSINEYKRRIQNDINGIIYKYSKYKYHILLNIEIVNKIMLDIILTELPYDKVKYEHDYNIQDKIDIVTQHILQTLKENDLIILKKKN